MFKSKSPIFVFNPPKKNSIYEGGIQKKHDIYQALFYFGLFFIALFGSIVCNDLLKQILPDSFLWWIKNQPEFYQFVSSFYEAALPVIFLSSVFLGAVFTFLYYIYFEVKMTLIWRCESALFSFLSFLIFYFLTLLFFGFFSQSFGNSVGDFLAPMIFVIILSISTLGYILFFSIRGYFFQKIDRSKNSDVATLGIFLILLYIFLTTNYFFHIIEIFLKALS